MSHKPLSPELTAYLDTVSKRLRKINFTDLRGGDMVERYGFIETCELLMTGSGAGTIQGSFKRLVKLGLEDCTYEYAVIKFPNEFSRAAVACAQFRIDNRVELSRLRA